MARADAWSERPLLDLVANVEGGVSVNSEGRTVRSGEVGVLMTSAVTYGRFDPRAHKAVLPSEIGRVRRPVRGGTVLFSRMNTQALVGASAYVPADHPRLFLPDRLWEIRAREGVDARWLSHQLGNPDTRRVIAGLASGTSASMKNISKEKLLGLRLLTPPLPEQRAIAAILTAIDEVIEKTEAVIAQVQVVKKAIMEELLTCGMPGMHMRFKHTEIGKIPEAWEVVRLGDVAHVFNGRAAGTGGSRLRVFKTKHVYDGFVRFDRMEFAREDEVPASTMLQSGDTLTPNMAHGTIGRVSFVPAAEPNWTIDGQVMVVRTRDAERAMPRFLFEFLSTELGRRQLLDREVGSVFGELRGQTHLYPRDVATIAVPLPAPAEQQGIAASLAAFDQPLSAERACLAQAQAIKVGLSHRLLSGDLRVSPDEAPE